MEKTESTNNTAAAKSDEGNGNSAVRANGSFAGVELAPEILRLLPADFVKEHKVLPLERANGTLRIAVAAPATDRVIDDIRLLSGLEVEEVDAEEHEILEKIAECYQVTVEQMIENLDTDQELADVTNLHDIEVMANEPTVINLVNVIISTALRERASDIHLVPFEKTLQLKYRIDGLLQDK